MQADSQNTRDHRTVAGDLMSSSLSLPDQRQDYIKKQNKKPNEPILQVELNRETTDLNEQAQVMPKQINEGIIPKHIIIQLHASQMKRINILYAEKV